MRAALEDFARNANRWEARVVALGQRGVRTAAVCPLRRVGGAIPVTRPFPHIANDVVDAIAVRWEGIDGTCPFVTIFAQILIGKTALPGVGHELAVRQEFVAPGVNGVLEPTARGVLPFGFGRNLLPRPCGVGLDIGIRHMHHRMIVETVEGAIRTLWMAPVRAEEERPPIRDVTQVDSMVRLCEYQRAGMKHLRKRAWVIGWIRRQ